MDIYELENKLKKTENKTIIDFSELENRLINLEKKSHENNYKENMRIISLEKKIENLENENNKFKNEKILSIKKDLNELKNSKKTLQKKILYKIYNSINNFEKIIKNLDLEKEENNLKISSIEKKFGELQLKMTLYDDLGKKISKLKEEITDKEKSFIYLENVIKKQSVKFFSSNLEEFIKTLERTFPRLVNQVDYHKDISYLEKKINNVEVPDFTSLSIRVDLIEKNLFKIQKILKKFSTKLTYVVE